MGSDALPLVVCLLGPTASGKTELACQLFDRLDVDLISVDSAMVYRGMDIGTAKPSPEELRRYPHALVDIRDPQIPYSVADFVDDANQQIDQSIARGRLPVLVGGTMLYFKRLFDGLASLPSADPDLRRTLDEEAGNIGWPALHARLETVDPAAASRIAPNDAQRIQRALEVFELTGVPISTLQTQAPPVRRRWCRLALYEPDRARLHARIAERFTRMLDEGFADEVERLMALPGMHAALPSMRAVGYRQLSRWLLGELTLDQAIDDAKTATRRLAKRQFTWLRGMSDVVRLDPNQPDLVDGVMHLVEAVSRAEVEPGV